MATEVFPVIKRAAPQAHINGPEHYDQLYKDSIENPDEFWGSCARKHLSWFHPFDHVSSGSLASGDVAWFLNGKLNVSYNCIDRHVLKGKDEKTAIIWEADDIGTGRSISFRELLRETCRVANLMKHFGVRKGDTVAIYMPMIPEIASVMLACTRIGAVHSVVFAGFSSDSLRDRIQDARCKWIFTSDEGKRGGRILPLKQVVDRAISGLDFVENVFVFRRTNNPNIPIVPPKDVDMTINLSRFRPYCPAEWMDSEDLLFILYTSGSTGSPKGVAHSTAGYLLYSMLTAKYTFDLQENDVFGCMADCGWITGHTYNIYGTLCNGTTTVLFESTPMFPDHCRYWDLIQRHRVTKFYTAPTAIRSLMACGSDNIKDYDLSSLKVLGSVGEPINPEAWKWYFDVVGKGSCYITDTYWQTETGGHVGVGLPGVTLMKPGSCGKPFFGIEFVLIDSNGNILEENDVEGQLFIKKPWPGLARTVYGDHWRYQSVYMTSHNGFYFTGDGAKRDKDGYYSITGRIDDVLSTSGHRIGTAEVEGALATHNIVAEAAVVGVPHAIKGEGICCYVVLVGASKPSIEVTTELMQQVRIAIGPFATPDLIVYPSALPKTRSGKIIRRLLRKIAAGEEGQLGDTSTMVNAEIVPELIQCFRDAVQKK
ncbi:unnamed protein product [Albugo candida]|uniref:Acetyl-coenzyme A synthetase n=1 Tax=Albugo candida TaxID=65357 RepID=A0A024GH49_9STRA|nr:unnamed protein product [Albugo candida]|eukprot:CCI46010.1 unnamed protein product [Albugo candida]